MKALLRVYGATLNFLHDEAGKQPSSSAKRAEGLFNRLTSIRMIFGFRVIVVLAEQLSILSKTLQARKLTHEVAMRRVQV